jgi:hypothetical protein
MAVLPKAKHQGKTAKKPITNLKAISPKMLGNAIRSMIMWSSCHIDMTAADHRVRPRDQTNYWYYGKIAINTEEQTRHDYAVCVAIWRIQMFKPILLLLAVMPMAVFAQDEEPDFEYETDRNYECHDRYSDDAKPYVFVETFPIPAEDIFGEIISEAPDDVSDDLSDEDIDQVLELLEGLEVLTAFKIAKVTISDTEFTGMAGQTGLDYRIDFGQNFEFDVSEPKTPYSLIIQADGDSSYYDFSNLESGGTKGADRLMTCERTQ